MGGLNSCCIPRKGFGEERHATTSTPKGKGHRRNLSATFNLSTIESEKSTVASLVNVNTAGEEELMTLPGINRCIAKNIIDHRNHIGGYRCTEDLALASGVGAERLATIRDDIYVIPPVLDDRKSSEGKAPLRLLSNASGDDENVTQVNINTANVFALLKVKGIGMGIAKNIVVYRDKHGTFSSVDDLIRVKGIGPTSLDAFRQYVCVADKFPVNSNDHSHQNGKSSCDHSSRGGLENDSDYTRRSTSSLENLLEILGPLAKIPERPNVAPITLKHKNRKVFRLASWNLERFSTEKAKNPGVKDVICMTILENGFSIIAVQELADEEALDEIVQELNHPTLPNVKKWSGRRGKWACVVSKAAGRMFQSMEYLGYLYDKSQNIEIVHHSLLQKKEGHKKPFVRMPYMGIFKINNNFDCVVTNVHLKATGLDDRDRHRTEKEVGTVTDLIDVIKAEIRGEKDVIIVGDFNLEPDTEAFSTLKSEDYTPCIPADTHTNISNSNVSGSKNYDNLWINKDTRKVYTGVSGVVRDGLSSHWIPNGWTWGGVVSDHCPVYGQFYSNMDLDPKDINTSDVSFTLGHAQIHR
ncbi:endonuclease/exonuclease/phosphatase family domain-containing protein 1 [Aplysia californica]|uniref:Endonuclease/exonuclease/phosphatase family domain-containing protein 1 n=1 Tax=Aplysia californica TaxID=6500 RepID=A0ABM1W2B4_APLCA|nr:endonuclease/exonuclease/phosphatase family domain-containing protein 1 [Aplysia californica]